MLSSFPRREVTDRLKREFPSFRTGRFSDEEDFEIQKHLGMLMFELEVFKRSVKMIALYINVFASIAVR